MTQAFSFWNGSQYKVRIKVWDDGLESLRQALDWCKAAECLRSGPILALNISLREFRLLENRFHLSLDGSSRPDLKQRQGRVAAKVGTRKSFIIAVVTPSPDYHFILYRISIPEAERLCLLRLITPIWLWLLTYWVQTQSPDFSGKTWDICVDYSVIMYIFRPS